MSQNKTLQKILNIETLYSLLCIIYVWILIYYAIVMWETRQRYSIIFLAMTLMLSSLLYLRKKRLIGPVGKAEKIFFLALFFLSFFSGIYFWVEFPSLVWERAGCINQTDMLFSAVFLYLVIHLTWATSGKIIPLVTLTFVAYALFGQWLPGVLYHPPISFTRFMEICCAEIDGVFGMLTQIGATWIAIFAVLAGFIQGFGGLDYILRATHRLVGSRRTGIPQISVIASMAFGGMSGSAAANAAGTGAFTIPIMKKFGIPSAEAAAIEAIASSGGQVMPPILGAAAFVMCDYLGMFYYEILFASIFSSIIFFGSTMLSVYFIAKRYISPDREVEMPPEFKEKMSTNYLLQGVPIAIAFIALLFIFIVYKVNILVGGFFTTVAFLVSRLLYEAIIARGRPSFVTAFVKGVYRGTLRGASMMIPIGAMLGCLGVVVRVLTTTGLAERLAYYTVSVSGGNLWLLLAVTLLICIVFGMAVTTVAAYILVVTLTAPALLQFGIEPLVAHFIVLYWAMTSAFTPPVAAACVITAGIAEANFFKTCWESIKLGSPKFLLPILFVTYPQLLSLTPSGFYTFLIAMVGFSGFTAGLQSGWGRWPQAILIVLGLLVILSPFATVTWTALCVTLVVLPVFWRRYSPRTAAASAFS